MRRRERQERKGGVVGMEGIKTREVQRDSRRFFHKWERDRCWKG